MACFPVRCYTCNKVIGNLVETYLEMCSKNDKKSDIFESLHVERMCCRRLFISFPYNDVTIESNVNVQEMLKENINVEIEKKTTHVRKILAR